MAILYKYMSFIDGFLKSPTIKLSPPCLLNDPFELHNSDDFKKLMYESYTSEGSPTLTLGSKEIPQNRLQVMIQNQPINIAARIGIVSLSESNRSLLMWAHYADQHKGIVVGFHDDFLSDVEIDEDARKNLIHTNMPIKISYDTARFDLMEYEKTGNSFKDVAKTLAIKLLTTKSDDWIYEKEHRYITPIAVADHINYLGGINGRTNEIRRMIANKQIKIDRQSKMVSIRDDIKMDHSIYVKMSRDSNFLFLKKINPKKIKSIFFGYRTPSDKISKYVLDIKDNVDELGHIELFKYKLCDTNFKLVKERIKMEDYLLVNILDQL